MIPLNASCQPREPDVAKDQRPSGILKVKKATVVALSHDGQKAITWDFEGHRDLQLWDVAEGKPIRSMHLQAAKPGHLFKVEFSPDEKKLLAVFGHLIFGDNFDRVFDLTSGKQLHQFPHRKGARDAIWAPDGKHILAGPMMRLWSLETGKEVRDFGTGASRVGFSADGKIAYSSDGGMIRSWNTATGKKLDELKFGDTRNYKVQFARNGRAMTTSWGIHPGVAVWDISKRKQLVETRFDGQGKRLAKDPDLDPPELFGNINIFEFAASW